MAAMESGSTAKTGDFFYGWDLLYKTVKADVSKKSDLLIALVHFLLTKHYNFRCVGVGDDVSMIMATHISEIIWNSIENLAGGGGQ